MPIFRKPISGADNLRLYLSEAVLPPMPLGSSAPLMPASGHKAHRNFIIVAPAPYRARFTNIVAPKALGAFDRVVLEFINSLPCTTLDEPNVDSTTGIAFTLPARRFNIPLPSLRHPSCLQELSLWLMAFPFQTMTRALHVAFPATRDWDVTSADADTEEDPDPDTAIWNTLLWRRVPPPRDPEKQWLTTAEPLGECNVVFAVQPPWVMSPQDFKSFMRCSSLPPFNSREPHNNRPFTCAERVWAKLWDMCVRKDCHHWVLSSYNGWVFGGFTKGYTAGQILDYKSYDSSEPTIIGCLVYHVATSMDLVTTARLPQFPEATWDLEPEIDIPPFCQLLDIEFADSGSEWDGMDDEPGISAGVSTAESILLSGWGSEVDCPPSRRPNGPYQDISLSQVGAWQDDLEEDHPPYERALSPIPSETGFSMIGLYSAAVRGTGYPKVVVTPRRDHSTFAGFLPVVVEQAPAEDEDL